MNYNTGGNDHLRGRAIIKRIIRGGWSITNRVPQMNRGGVHNQEGIKIMIEILEWVPEKGKGKRQM